LEIVGVSQEVLVATLEDIVWDVGVAPITQFIRIVDHGAFEVDTAYCGHISG
jgi:hypothetical protein